MKVTTALAAGFIGLAAALPNEVAIGKTWTISKRDDDYNTTCSNQQWRSFANGPIFQLTKDWTGKSDSLTLGDKDSNGCSQAKCTCSSAVSVCGYKSVPVISQGDIASRMAASFTDCGFQWSNTGSGDKDGLWGVQIWLADYNIIVAGIDGCSC